LCVGGDPLARSQYGCTFRWRPVALLGIVHTCCPLVMVASFFLHVVTNLCIVNLQGFLETLRHPCRCRHKKSPHGAR
jgi:hypothetical protein